MHVAIAIVGFRNPQDIMGCLEALASTTHRDFEVVICENGGPEAFATLSAQLPARVGPGRPVRAVLAQSNLGYAGGVNVCLREAPGADAWWVLNPDTLPDPGALAAMVARLQRGDCDAVGSVVYADSGTIQSVGGLWRRALARAVSIGHGQPLDRLPALAGEVEARQNYLNGASMLVSARFVTVAGPMREDYFLYCEEVEWCLRAQARGLRLGFADDARVMHHQGTSTGYSAEIRRQGRMPVYLNERNRLLLTRDLTPGWLPLTAVLAIALLLARFARRGAWRQLGYALQGWRAGLRGERGIPAWV
jgi:GT2 family glycosyltransferase